MPPAGEPSRAHSWTLAVFAAAVICDVVLAPLGFGPDFVAWDIASRATLNGANIYAQHPAGYPTGPFAYPPLFLYFELPFQYAARHLGWSFAILGKIPIVLADLACGWLIAKHSIDRGASDRKTALLTALYLLNPLVLYNSAFYGRFDSVGLAFFLLALRLHEAPGARARRWFPVAYGAAIATKIFPAFVAPWFWWNEPGPRFKTFSVTMLTIAALCLPFLLTRPRPFITDILFVNINQYAQGLSWQVAFMGKLPLQAVLATSYGLLAIFLIAANNWAAGDLYRYCLRILLLFTLLSKVVYEQYLVWSLPFVIVGLARRPAASWALLVALTVGGMISNPHLHPFGEQVVPINLLLAAAIATYLWTDRRHRGEAALTPAT